MTVPEPIGMHGAVDLSALARANAPGGGADEVTDATFSTVVERSLVVPIVLGLWADVSPASRELMDELASVAAPFEGRLVVMRCDIQSNPGVAEALQANSVPAVVALIGGRPAPLFQGSATREQIASLYEQILQIAEGTAAPRGPGPDAPSAAASPARAASPAHAEAYDAMERGDAAAAVEAFEKALRDSPKDSEARAGLAHARLLVRTEGADLEALVAATDAQPGSTEAALAAADADVALGRAESAFARLIALVTVTSGDERERVRLRLIDLFEIVGTQDPRVVAARRDLATALY